MKKIQVTHSNGCVELFTCTEISSDGYFLWIFDEMGPLYRRLMSEIRYVGPAEGVVAISVQ